MPGLTARRLRAPGAALLSTVLVPSILAVTPARAAPSAADEIRDTLQSPYRVDGTIRVPDLDHLVFSYDLPEGSYRVRFWLDVGSIAPDPFSPEHVSGHVGDDVPGGPDRRIVWNALEDDFFVSGEEIVWVVATPSEPGGFRLTDGPLPGLVFAAVPAGSGVLGSPPDEVGRKKHERTPVALSFPAFEISSTEIPQEVWTAVFDENPSKMKGDRRPVENVTFAEAIAFCLRLDELDPTYVHRLPTEIEWEYACRSGTTSPYYWDGERDVPGVGIAPRGAVGVQRFGWFARNASKRTHDVGTKEPNAWGVCDMHGNVWEWCLDEWTETPIVSAVEDDAEARWRQITTDVAAQCAPGPRIVRGGSWRDPAKDCRAASRREMKSDARKKNVGFRVVRHPVGAP